MGFSRSWAVSVHCVMGVGPSVDRIWDQLHASEARLGSKRAMPTTGRTLETGTSGGDSDGRRLQGAGVELHTCPLSKRTVRQDNWTRRYDH